jgi:hypothetical protein
LGFDAPGFGTFPSTHWRVVLTAGQNSNPAAQAALEQLCRAYWYPLYAFVRRRGHSPEDAQDLTQGFFERLLERDLLADLTPAGARFRSFLLQAMKNHLASEWTRAHAGKRGGAQSILSLDELGAQGIWVSDSIITLGATRGTAPGLLQLELAGPAGLAYSIQTSTDLVSWRDLTTITNAQSSDVITLDALPSAAQHQFYRAYSR